MCGGSSGTQQVAIEEHQGSHLLGIGWGTLANSTWDEYYLGLELSAPCFHLVPSLQGSCSPAVTQKSHRAEP